ncbi:MAG: DNA polymerase III subunit delta [Calditrichia bacterium]
MQKLNYNSALAAVKKGPLQPVYFIYGDENFLIDALVQKITAAFIGTPDKEINYFLRYAPEAAMEDVLSLTAGASLFSEKKVVVYRDFQQLRNPPMDKLLSYLKRTDPDICLVITARIDSVNQAKYQKIAGLASMVHVTSLREGDLNRFIQDEFKRYNKTIDTEALQTLMYLVGEKIHDLKTEIAQVVNFYRDRGAITSADIEAVVGVHAVQNVFELTRQIARKNLDEAVFTTRNLLEKGESAHAILALLTRHMIILWKIRGFYNSGQKNEKTIMQRLRLYPKQFRAYVSELTHWSLPQLKKSLSLLEECDRLLKSGQSTEHVIMDMLIFKLNRL